LVCSGARRGACRERSALAPLRDDPGGIGIGRQPADAGVAPRDVVVAPPLLESGLCLAQRGERLGPPCAFDFKCVVLIAVNQSMETLI